MVKDQYGLALEFQTFPNHSDRISNFKLIVNQYCEVHYLLINLYRLLNDRKVIKERWSYLHINFLVEFLEWLPEKL
ncbi:unnamed protein product [Rhizophagus irregularis]|nr:unnamed protein product [Rhizophagus irregularis]